MYRNGDTAGRTRVKNPAQWRQLFHLNRLNRLTKTIFKALRLFDSTASAERHSRELYDGEAAKASS